MTDHHLADLDHQITTVARRMTDAEPPAHLHARVMAQLNERTSSLWAWRWLPVATGLLAVALVAVVIVRRSPASFQAVAPQESAAAGSTRPAPQARDAGPINPADTPLANTTGTRTTSDESSPRMSEVQAEWQARALPPLSQPQALAFDGIQPDALAIRPLETRPLVIMPIAGAEDR